MVKFIKRICFILGDKNIDEDDMAFVSVLITILVFGLLVLIYLLIKYFLYHS